MVWPRPDPSAWVTRSPIRDKLPDPGSGRGLDTAGGEIPHEGQPQALHEHDDARDGHGHPDQPDHPAAAGVSHHLRGVALLLGGLRGPGTDQQLHSGVGKEAVNQPADQRLQPAPSLAPFAGDAESRLGQSPQRIAGESRREQPDDPAAERASPVLVPGHPSGRPRRVPRAPPAAPGRPSRGRPDHERSTRPEPPSPSAPCRQLARRHLPPAKPPAPAPSPLASTKLQSCHDAPPASSSVKLYPEPAAESHQQMRGRASTASRPGLSFVESAGSVGPENDHRRQWPSRRRCVPIECASSAAKRRPRRRRRRQRGAGISGRSAGVCGRGGVRVPS